MARRLRARCPTCGMMANLEAFQKSYKVEVFVQEFGGKVPGAGSRKGEGKGAAPGSIDYRNITNTKEGKEVIKKIQEKIG